MWCGRQEPQIDDGIPFKTLFIDENLILTRIFFVKEIREAV